MNGPHFALPIADSAGPEADGAAEVADDRANDKTMYCKQLADSCAAAGDLR